MNSRATSLKVSPGGTLVIGIRRLSAVGSIPALIFALTSSRRAQASRRPVGKARGPSAPACPGIDRRAARGATHWAVPKIGGRRRQTAMRVLPGLAPRHFASVRATLAFPPALGPLVPRRLFQTPGIPRKYTEFS